MVQYGLKSLSMGKCNQQTQNHQHRLLRPCVDVIHKRNKRFEFLCILRFVFDVSLNLNAQCMYFQEVKNIHTYTYMDYETPSFL